ncbi:MAG: thiamine-phosphate synthase family protein [Halobacteriota archaeon]
MKLEDDIEVHGKMAIALDILEQCAAFAPLIPEVRTNLVYAKPHAQTTDEVLAIEGRITVVNGLPRGAGKPRFGASSHMARLVLELAKRDPSIRAGVNFASTPPLMKWLEAYCETQGWAFSVIDRSAEPEEIKGTEGASMPWKIKEAIKAAGERVPKVFYETGAVGKEPVSVLVGKDPIEVAEEICEIARRYNVGP